MVTHRELKEILWYDRETGVFRWKVRAKSTVRPGDIAGRGKPNSAGYMRIGIQGKSYLLHRLAWFYETGEWPTGQIDHIDLNRTNNKWENLRQATPTQNITNRGVQANSTSGVKGVSFDARKGRWRAYITVGRKQQWLGYFDTKEDAALVATQSREKQHKEFHKP